MPDWMPEFVTPQFIVSMIVLVTVLHIALGLAAYFILLERKLSAWMQDRYGPNRTGPFGLLQPIADGLKLFLKEDFTPKGVDKTLFTLAPVMTAIPALLSFVIIPYGGTLDLSTIPFLGLTGQVEIVGANVSIGVLFLVATASLAVYGIVLGGWSSNNKYSFLGGLRASAQMISYEIPMGLTLLCVILLAGSIRPVEIVEAQTSGAAGAWFIVHQPLAAIIFYVCMLAESNRTPFDLAEAEAELVGGWHTEYSSMRWALFFLGEYINLFVGGAFFAVLFLGGWSLNPVAGLLPFDVPTQGGILMIILQVGVVMGKAVALVAFAQLIRWTLPRFRFDQLMRLAWEGMIPASLLLLLVTSFFVLMGWTGLMWAGSLGAMAIIWIVHPHMPRQKNPNHKVAMVGSRFNPITTGPGSSSPRAASALD